METQNLFNMKLHQKVEIDSTTSVHRVPGGWIYLHSLQNENGIITLTSSFVPKNNEFKEETGVYAVR